MSSLDRFGTTSIITQQCSEVCASLSFVAELSSRLGKLGLQGMRSDDGGVFTDSYRFIDMFDTATNLSVGYYG